MAARSICAQVVHASKALNAFKDHEDTKTYVSMEGLQSMTSGFRGERRATVVDVEQKVNRK